MKKLIVFIVVLAITGIANAELLTNGDFEDPAGSGWTQWWGGNSNKYVADPVEADNCAGIWWSDDGMYQNAGWLDAGVYEFSGDLLTTLEGGLVDRSAIIQAEMGDGVDVWWVQQLTIGPGDAENVWHARIDTITLADPTFVAINLMMGDGAAPAGNVYFDNVSLVPEPATLALLGMGGLLLRRRRK